MIGPLENTTINYAMRKLCYVYFKRKPCSMYYKSLMTKMRTSLV